jgi:hypothetical protein
MQARLAKQPNTQPVDAINTTVNAVLNAHVEQMQQAELNKRALEVKGRLYARVQQYLQDRAGSRKLSDVKDIGELFSSNDQHSRRHYEFLTNQILSICDDTTMKAAKRAIEDYAPRTSDSRRIHQAVNHMLGGGDIYHPPLFPSNLEIPNQEKIAHNQLVLQQRITQFVGKKFAELYKDACKALHPNLNNLLIIHKEFEKADIELKRHQKSKRPADVYHQQLSDAQQKHAKAVKAAAKKYTADDFVVREYAEKLGNDYSYEVAYCKRTSTVVKSAEEVAEAWNKDNQKCLNENSDLLSKLQSQQSQVDVQDQAWCAREQELKVAHNEKHRLFGERYNQVARLGLKSSANAYIKVRVRERNENWTPEQSATERLRAMLGERQFQAAIQQLVRETVAEFPLDEPVVHDLRPVTVAPAKTASEQKSPAASVKQVQPDAIAAIKVTSPNQRQLNVPVARPVTPVAVDPMKTVSKQNSPTASVKQVQPDATPANSVVVPNQKQQLDTKVVAALNEHKSALFQGLSDAGAKQQATAELMKIRGDNSLFAYYQTFVTLLSSNWHACQAIHSDRVANDKRSTVDNMVKGMGRLGGQVPLVSAATGAVEALYDYWRAPDKANEVATIAGCLRVSEALEIIDSLASEVTLAKSQEIKSASHSSHGYLRGIWEQITRRKATPVELQAINDCEQLLQRIVQHQPQLKSVMKTEMKVLRDLVTTNPSPTLPVTHAPSIVAMPTAAKADTSTTDAELRRQLAAQQKMMETMQHRLEKQERQIAQLTAATSPRAVTISGSDSAQAYAVAEPNADHQREQANDLAADRAQLRAVALVVAAHEDAIMNLQSRSRHILLPRCNATSSTAASAGNNNVYRNMQH